MQKQLLAFIVIVLGCITGQACSSGPSGASGQAGFSFYEEYDTDDYVADRLRREQATNFIQYSSPGHQQK